MRCSSIRFAVASLLTFFRVVYATHDLSSDALANYYGTRVSVMREHLVDRGEPVVFGETEQNQAYFSAGPSPFFIYPSNDAKKSAAPQTSCPSKKLVMAYYPDWVGDVFPPEKIDYNRFDWIDFAFALPTANFSLTWDQPQKGPGLLKRLVAGAHAHGKKVKLSVGGWTGSKYFSSAVATAQSRTTFVNNILAAYKTFNVDGIDIDWEYPGRAGAPGNQWTSKDSASYLLFLKQLRSALPSSARISAAAETTTFVGDKGKAMTDVTEFGQVLDWVLLMNYDVWGSSSKPGPNAPLRDACGNSTQPDANAVAAVRAWVGAHFPICKLVLGLPSYGYLSSSSATRLRTRSKSKDKVKTEQSAFVKVINEDGGSDGQVQFNSLLQQGALQRSTSMTSDGRTTTSFIGGGGFERHWDSCSDTPFLRSSHTRQVIPYDDPESLRMKASFAKQVGLLGINLFDLHGDTDKWELTDAIRDALA